MIDLRQRLAEALSLAATTRGYRLRDERFHLADGVLPIVRGEVAAELRRILAELESGRYGSTSAMVACVRRRIGALDKQDGQS